MKKIKIFLLLIIISLSITSVTAKTIRETTNKNDEYDTIEPNTFIIGITKFPGNEVITASKAAVAGSNDAIFYARQNGTSLGYKSPAIYLYLGEEIGWFSIDQNNNISQITDRETINKLSSIDIYYISNRLK